MTTPNPIILPLITPTTNAVGDGAIVSEKIGTYSNDHIYPSDDDRRSDQACWRFTATPNAGFSFIKLRITIEVSVDEEVITFGKDVYSPIYRTHWFSSDDVGYWYKAGEPADWDTDERFFITSCAESTWVYPAWGIDGSKLTRFRTKSLSVTAFFTRQPTHLLVNSSTVESPAHLVYDPATNLLVADY